MESVLHVLMQRSGGELGSEHLGPLSRLHGLLLGISMGQIVNRAVSHL